MADDAISGALCAVNGCDSKILSRGWCSIHYTRWRKHGDPLAVHVKAKEKAARKAARLLAKPPVQKQQPRTCYFCEEVFYRTGGNGPNGRDAGKCCSRACGFKWQGARKAANHPPKHEISKAKCEGCMSWFVKTNENQRFCSTVCTPSRYIKVSHVGRLCAECGSIFTPTVKTNACCSSKCQRLRDKRLQVESGAKAARRKARKMRLRGVVVETVNPLVVLKRDRWTCQLCGVKTPQHLRGSYDDRAPEVDHINPLSQGGEHSYRNTQCACRKCNIAKSGTPKGQLRLFG